MRIIKTNYPPHYQRIIGVSIHPLNRKMEFQGYKSVRDIAPTLTAHDGRGGEPCVWFEETPKIIPLVPWNRPGEPTDVCPTITASSFEHNNYVMEPQILTQRRTEEGRELRKQGIEAFKYKELVPREDGVCNTLTCVQKDNMLLEPSGMYDNQNGDFFRSPIPNLARTLKADCHNAVLEPTQVIGSNQANAYVGSVEGVSPCVNAATGMGGGHVPMVTEEPKIVGYTRDDKGRVESYHFKETANTLHTGGGTTAQYVAESQRTTPPYCRGREAA